MNDDFDPVAALDAAETFYKEQLLAATDAVGQKCAELAGLLLETAMQIVGQPALEQMLFAACKRHGKNVKRKKGVSNAVSAWVIPAKSPAYRTRYTTLTTMGLERKMRPQDLVDFVVTAGGLDPAYDKARGKVPKSSKAAKAAKAERLNRLSEQASSEKAGIDGYVDVSKVRSDDGSPYAVALLRRVEPDDDNAIPIFLSGERSLIARLLEEWSKTEASQASKDAAHSSAANDAEANADAIEMLRRSVGVTRSITQEGRDSAP